jgi:hypothetical protein
MASQWLRRGDGFANRCNRQAELRSVIEFNLEKNICLCALSATMTTTNAVDDKTVVREYFNATGFDRWRRIYGDGDVNKVQLDIRKGHQQTVDTVMAWLTEDDLAGVHRCDAGCAWAASLYRWRLPGPRFTPATFPPRWWKRLSSELPIPWSRGKSRNFRSLIWRISAGSITPLPAWMC